MVRQNGCYEEGFEIDPEDESNLGDQMEYVWAKLRKYNRDSRMTPTGKDKFLENLQRKFQKGDFVTETQKWFDDLVETQSGHGQSLSSLRTPIPSINDGAAALEQAEKVRKRIDEKLEDANMNIDNDNGSEERMVRFSRQLKNSREQENKYQGFGYALSVYLMYAFLVFALVYVYETSHCEAEADAASVVQFITREDGIQTNWTSWQTDIVVVKNSRTSTIFGGVYGLDSNSGMYLFDGADSEAYYMSNYKIPVPRPACATSCTPQLVCYRPQCTSYDANFNRITVDIDVSHPLKPEP